jgi:small ligand-binding sensory domain FIST
LRGVPSAGVGLSLLPDPIEAADQAALAALASCPKPEAALLYVTPGHAEQTRKLVERVVDVLGTRAVVGATAHGVVAAGREQEGGTAVSLIAMAGLEAQTLLVHELAGDGEHVGEDVAARLGEPRAEDLVVLLPDPRGLRSDALLEGVRRALGPARVVGAGAADPIRAHPLQWCGTEIEEGALAALALRTPRPARIGVTQACRPVTEVQRATRVQGNWVLEIDGRPALDLYREAAGGGLADDLRRAAAFVLAALPRDEQAPLAPGGYLVRNVVGFAPDERALALPTPLATGDPIAFVHREPEGARQDLKDVLERLGAQAPAFGLWFDCCARGASFFGVPGLEAAYLESAFGDAPVAGMFGSCEIGPVAGQVELLTYTGVLALVDA